MLLTLHPEAPEHYVRALQPPLHPHALSVFDMPHGGHGGAVMAVPVVQPLVELTPLPPAMAAGFMPMSAPLSGPSSFGGMLPSLPELVLQSPPMPPPPPRSARII
jgi:hypothetical protein